MPYGLNFLRNYDPRYASEADARDEDDLGYPEDNYGDEHEGGDQATSSTSRSRSRELPRKPCAPSREEAARSAESISRRCGIG
jgi:hypothetical protein